MELRSKKGQADQKTKFAGSLTCYFDEKHILKLFPLSPCQYVSTIPEKNCMLPTFEKSTFCRGFYRENDGPPL